MLFLFLSYLFLPFSLAYPSLSTPSSSEDPIKALFLFKDVLSSNTTAITTTGFNTLLIFNVEVTNTSDLVYPRRTGVGDDISTPLVSNGTYISNTNTTLLASQIRSLKSLPNSQISRVEVTLVSGYPTFENIRDAINRDGISPDTTLYRNFAALKEAWGIDAINNDDEGVYDIPSTILFSHMLGNMGYQLSGAPYTNITFWKNVTQTVNSQTPGLWDRMYLQCYDGGSGNDPTEWEEGVGMKTVPLLWVTNDAKPAEGKTPMEAEVVFEGYERDAVVGGGYWNDYDIEKLGGSYEEYEGVLEKVFG
ncbi:uncharacterized protein RCC_04657 [Ramularia collo-cygni]|uniref:Uncharacterized protein n=1 Tax=Ramularia collo-cygni TaxID=112498 RepID=A0A2D3VDZ0_9PEZI|nr:uncharacterized protein RCC_04657 [Ramularia collo-cygni]CZT18813.1 uncharacterized protein RCC_04657 [Ramularia collo-cygni]